MSEQPLISIVTITYNAGAELVPTMVSVDQQTFRDYEHLIIDGASTDDTLEVATRLRNPNLRIISEPDKGLYDAMNKGLKFATGKYVLFLNAGDAFHSPDTLAKYAAACESDPDIVYGDTVIVNAAREVLGPRHLSVPEELTLGSFADGMLVCHQAFLAKRSIVPMYDTAYRFSADYDWTVKCLKQTDPSRCVNLHCVTIDYLTAGTTDKNKLKSLRERFRIMCHHYGLLPTLARHGKFVLRAMRRKSL